jgi:hypothetical protein
VTQDERVGGRRIITTPQVKRSTMRRMFKEGRDIFIEASSKVDRVSVTVKE